MAIALGGRTDCPICLSECARFVVTIPFTSASAAPRTPVVRCGRCGSYRRESLSQADRLAHFESASYTDPSNEEGLRRRRGALFESFLELARLDDATGPPSRVLDVGSAYGHLVGLCAERGHTCCAVEPVGRLRERLADAVGADAVFPDVASLPSHLRFDVVFMIDSIYCLPRPADDVRRVSELLAPGGRLIIRNSNRAPLLDVMVRARMARRITDRQFGSAVVIVSHRGLTGLLRSVSLEQEPVTPQTIETNPGASPFERFGRQALITTTRFTPAKVAVGLVYVATRTMPTP